MRKLKTEINVNQDKNTLVKKKRQIPEISQEHGFLDEKLQMLKHIRSSFIAKIAYNINKTWKNLKW